MFAADSERGRSRNQGSWRSYDGAQNHGGHNSSHDNFGRSHDSEGPATSNIVCQNFLQNKCMRGNSCLFQHPSQSAGASSRMPTLNSKMQQNPWLNFCIDFQKGQCPFSDECRLLHVSKADEAGYHETGDISNGVLEQAMSKAMVMDWAFVGKTPHCKEFLQGVCNMNGCNYRHLKPNQYIVELLAALREKFMIPRSEMFPEDTESGFMLSDQSDRYSMHQSSGSSSAMYGGGGNNYEPEPKRKRAMDGGSDDRRSRWSDNTLLPSIPVASDRFPQVQATSDENFVSELRQHNSNLTKVNTDVKSTAMVLEAENTELRKALNLALDLNSRARSLQEFRVQLQEIQMSLRKKGYGDGVDDVQPSGSWNDMQMGRGSSQDSRMMRDRYSPDNYDRMEEPRSGSSGSSRFNSRW